MRLELVTAPAAEPVVLADAKTHLRFTSSTSEDALITRLIGAARRQVEATLRRKLITQHWRIYFDGFPGAIWRSYWSSYPGDLVLPDVAPVSAIDSVKYLDTTGTLQTLDPSVYQLVAEAPARLTTAYAQSWPALRGDREGVRVEVTCGYGVAGADVPEDILAAIYLLIGYLFKFRETVVTAQPFEVPGVPALLTPYIVPAF